MNSGLKKIVLLIGALGLVVLAAVAVMNLMKQPEKTDYQSLDTHRQIVDSSMNIYSPLLTGFSSEYTNLYVEERPTEEKEAYKKRYMEVLEQERRVNEAYLKRMGSSVALREPSVKEAFETFRSRYGAVISYYDQYAHDIASTIEAVTGPCARLSKLNVAKASYASDYTSAADTCLAALAEAKKTSDPTTDTLLADVEALIKTRRDKFEQTLGKEGFEKNAATILALVEMLDINADIKDIQEKYQAKVQTEYMALIDEANKANSALKDALKAYLATGSEKGSGA